VLRIRRAATIAEEEDFVAAVQRGVDRGRNLFNHGQALRQTLNGGAMSGELGGENVRQ
jgi:hypothetical protein